MLVLVAGLLAGSAYACPFPAADRGGVQNVHTRTLETNVGGEPLAARMRRYKVPGVGVAVIHRGALAWARGWGVADARTCAPVDAATAFQAASISKPVAALTVVRLAERDLLDLDADLAGAVPGWVPGTTGITLRALLSHTSSLGVHGFPGYSAGQRVPTLLQILEGRPPANTPAVRPETAPGTFSYSGGGYEVAEAAIAAKLGQPYRTVAEAEVLRPLGLAAGFEAPAGAASGHLGGARIPGGSNFYPEAAAAGLWGTPADIARLLIAIGSAASSGSGPVSREAAQAMLTPVSPGYGLGLQLAGAGGTRRFGHTGSNEGYRAIALAFAESGDGVVVMTNADEGGVLAQEIAAAVAADYGWPATGL